MSQKSCCSSSEVSEASQTTQPAQAHSLPLSAYTPLIVIILATLLSASALELSSPASSFHRWMHHFMGLFLVIFAIVKLFNLRAFAAGFAKYDLLAARSSSYARFYPFLELSLGLSYLAFHQEWPAKLTYLATILILSFGTLGVLDTIRKKKQIDCACMGQLLKVPVSTVTLTENLSMSAMALLMLLN